MNWRLSPAMPLTAGNTCRNGFRKKRPGWPLLVGKPDYLPHRRTGELRIHHLGLGDANPRTILLVPLKYNGQTEGVLELASFRTFAPHEITFLEKVCESAAATFNHQRMMQQLNQPQEKPCRNTRCKVKKAGNASLQAGFCFPVNRDSYHLSSPPSRTGSNDLPADTGRAALH